MGISLVSIMLVCHADAPHNSLKAFSVYFAVFRKHLVMLKYMNNLTAFLVMCFKFHPHKRPVSHIVSAVIKGSFLYLCLGGNTDTVSCTSSEVVMLIEKMRKKNWAFCFLLNMSLVYYSEICQVDQQVTLGS